MHDDEGDAITALQSGDIEGLHTLVKRYQLPALRVAFNCCGNQQVAEDAVAEAFLAVARHIGAYNPSRPFDPWFYRIVMNAVRTALSHERRLAAVCDADRHLQVRPDPGPGPEGLALQTETRHLLLHEVDRLPQKQREVVILRYYLDMEERRMAEVLGVPAGTVKWRLFQARKTLRHQMQEEHEGYRTLKEEEQAL